ncbi:MAG: hypothetical protein ABI129_04745 [Rhodanobacter sp.]
MSISPRAALAAMAIAAVAITGCAHKTTTRSQNSTSPSSSSASPSTTVSPTVTRARQHATPAAPATSDAGLPEQTGIAACDDYLSSYLACHRAAKIFAPDQLQDRYEAMRTTLLRDSQNPEVRPLLAGRCNQLSRSLRQALHGKPCATNPAPSSSSP